MAPLSKVEGAAMDVSGRCGRALRGGGRQGWSRLAPRAAKSTESYVRTTDVSGYKGNSLRRILAKETLARRYYELTLPGVCVHVAYLRKPLQYLKIDSSKKDSADSDVLIGGSKLKSDRVDDFLHFELLCSELVGGSLEYPIASGGSQVEDDLQVTIDIDRDLVVRREEGEGDGKDEAAGPSSTGNGAASAKSGGTDEEEEGSTGEEQQRRSVASKIPLRIRYQQFTEFTSYTFELPYLDPENTMKDGFNQGEQLIVALKGIDNWWGEIPGEIFVVAIINSRGVESRGDKIVYDPLKLQEDLYSIRSESSYPGDSPTGCFVGEQDKQMGIFVNYALQPFTDYLYVAVLYHERATYVERQQYSRQVQRFLELEEYRLLCLSATSIAKYLFIALESINEELLQVLNDFKSSEVSFKERKRALESIIDLQNRSETLGIGIRDRFGASEAYGNVVFRRLDRMVCKQARGTQNFQGFVRKRLEPALRTYRSAGERLDETTDAVSRASNLLRCKIDLDIQEQNDNLLIIGTFLSVSSFSLAIFQFLEKIDVI